MRPNLSSIWSKGSRLGSSLEAKTVNLLGFGGKLRVPGNLLLEEHINGQTGIRQVKEEEAVELVVVVATVRARPSIFSER